MEYVEGPSPDRRYNLDDGDFWAASSDGRYYAQVWMRGAEPPDPSIDSVQSDLGPGQAHEGWLIFLVAVDDPAPLLTYKTWSLEHPNVVTPQCSNSTAVVEAVRRSPSATGRPAAD